MLSFFKGLQKDPARPPSATAQPRADAQSQQSPAAVPAGRPGTAMMFVNYSTDTGRRQSNRDVSRGVVPVLTEVHDGRRSVPPPTLATHGFELARFGNQGTDAFGPGLPLREDYLSDQMVRQILYPWCEGVVAHSTGAALVKCFHHLVRSNRKDAEHTYASLAHCDYTTKTAYTLFDSMPQSSEGGFKHFRGRYAVLNVWKNINPDVPIANNFLAMCDATTVAAPDDFIEFDQYDTPTDVTPKSQSFHMSGNNHRRHRWFYYPNMTIAEAIVFMQYDSDCRRPCRYTFHTSLADPNGPVNFNRESIELRLVAWFPDPDPLNNTLPDFSVPPHMRVPGAVAAIREAVTHVKSWDTKGTTWLHGCVVSGNFAGIVRGICTHGRSEGNKGVYKDLADGDIQEVTRILLADGVFATSLIEATGVRPQAATAAPQKLDEACRHVLHSIKHVAHWDQKGKSWVTGCVQQGDCEGVARGLLAFMRSDAKTPQFATLSDGDINLAATRLMGEMRFAEALRDAAKNIK